jgi:hypothetical protein
MYNASSHQVQCIHGAKKTGYVLWAWLDLNTKLKLPLQLILTHMMAEISKNDALQAKRH